MHPSPNNSRSTAIVCQAKYELTEKGLQEEFRVLKQRFLIEKIKKKGSADYGIPDFRQQRQTKYSR